MFGLGIWELLIILIIVLVLFSGKLPGVGEDLGKSIRKFRKTLGDSDEIDITPKDGHDKEGQGKESS
jgi:sec-independent protein translocase protein TatA